MAFKKAVDTSVFNGQSCIIVFDEVSDYSTATFDTITANGFDVGQVFQGSTAWNGEDPSFEDKLDEKGNIIVSDPQNGTMGFDFEMADYSAEKLTTFLKGRKITQSAALTSSVFKGTPEITAVGDQLPVITRPVALVNDSADRILFFPKARIVTGTSMEDKLAVLKSIVKAQDCNTTNLGTMMLIDKAKLNLSA